MSLINRLVRRASVAALWLAIAAMSAYAHGGMAGPDELGPPVITSAVLGIACYWAVMLWPSRKNRNINKSGKAVRRLVR
jgi:hypothetical protein